jgi:hypothetical protein
LFLIISLGIYFTYGNLVEIVGRTRSRTLVSNLLNREIELIRNLPYEKVGIVGGVPAGEIPAQRTVLYEGQYFTIDATVRNIDDPFDGTLGGVPNDTAPADYRLVELTINCHT